MKFAIQYLNDKTGNIQAVQVPFSEWKNVMAKYEQMLKMKSDLSEAFEEVEQIGKSKGC
jgi:hypothetical protein